MTNCFTARATWNGLHWIGEFRCADQAAFQQVRRHDSEAIGFATKQEAQMAADEALRAYMNGRLRRDGAAAGREMGDAFLRSSRQDVKRAQVHHRPGKRPFVEMQGKA